MSGPPCSNDRPWERSRIGGVPGHRLLPGRFATALALTTTAALALSGCTKKNESDAGGSGDAGPKTYKVAFVAKLQGVPYSEAMNAGGEQAAAALGNVEWLYQGPTQAWAGAQIAQGKTIEATNNVSSDLPAVTYDSASKMLLLGPALAITAENVDQFDY